MVPLSYLGQEANAVGVLSPIHENDIFSAIIDVNGHFLAYGVDPYALLLKLMGRSTGSVRAGWFTTSSLENFTRTGF